jgi:hypothetical protein
LDRDVPALSFDFQSRTEEKLAEISDFDFVKVVINNPIFSSVIQRWVVSKPRGFHTDHTQTPGRNVLELSAEND